MMNKRVKEGSAILLALALAFSAFTLPKAYAADAVDINASCSVEFSIGGDNQELKEAEGGIGVSLYKVASVSETGVYTAVQGFDNLDFSSIENGEGSADTWQKRAKEANKLITDATPAAEKTTINAGKAVINNLSTGLYLVVANAVTSANYEYNFTPYLISLPNNYFYDSGNDEWVYNLTGANAIGLKPERTERYGSLSITKELVNHQGTFGSGATFVFQIDITTLAGETESRQIALTFDSAGSKTATIDNIPSGAQVVVNEIYSGAGYEITADSSLIQNTVIPADGTAAVTFRNEVSDVIHGGYGVVNHFQLNENDQYDWNQMNDNADAAE